MHCERRPLGRRALTLLLIVGGASTASAQLATETVQVADYSFGFELTVPGGSWTYDRGRFTLDAGPGAVGVLRGRSTAQRSTMQVLFYRLAADASFDKWLDDLQRQIIQEAGAKTVKTSHELRKLGDRDAAVITAEDSLTTGTVRTHYYCVRFDETRVFVLLLGGATPDESVGARLRSEFERIVSSLRILYTRERQAELAEALLRGQKLLETLRRAAAALPIDSATRYYEIVQRGEPGGFFTRQIEREVRSLDDPRSGGNVKEGVRVRERSWQFGRDGTARSSRVDLFASSDMLSELIETRESEVPGENAVIRQVFSSVDSCIREEGKLITSFKSSLDVEIPPSREQRVGPNYLGLVWVRLLPALLGTEPGEPCAFAIYDTGTRAIVTYVIRSLGPRPLPETGDVTAYAYEVSEAFSPKPSITYTDERGVVLRVEAGDIVFRSTTPQHIEKRYGVLRDAARALLRVDGKP